MAHRAPLDAPLRARSAGAARPVPAHYLADRLRRLRFVSVARPGAATRGALARDVAACLARVSSRDPDLFVAGAPGTPGTSALRAGERPLDDRLFARATLDGTIRALYAALRPYHVVAVGPGRLIELAERLPFASFTLKAVDPLDPAGRRHTILEDLVGGHRRFCGEPTAYLFHAGAVAPWWVLRLHGRLRNAALLDLGPALDACVQERVLMPAWGWIHWQAVARHLGLDPGPPPRDAAPGASAPARSPAPGRPRPPARRPAVERRRASASRGDAPAAGVRLREGDLRRCLLDALERGAP
jgi:hypothetical protein